DEGDEPIAAGAIAEIARGKEQRVAKKLAKSRDNADDGGARSEDAKVGAGDAARAFIGHVGEETDHAKQHDETYGAASGKDDAGSRGHAQLQFSVRLAGPRGQGDKAT